VKKKKYRKCGRIYALKQIVTVIEPVLPAVIPAVLGVER